jgi:hypothetical protein
MSGEEKTRKKFVQASACAAVDSADGTSAEQISMRARSGRDTRKMRTAEQYPCAHGLTDNMNVAITKNF